MSMATGEAAIREVASFRGASGTSHPRSTEIPENASDAQGETTACQSQILHLLPNSLASSEMPAEAVDIEHAIEPPSLPDSAALAYVKAVNAKIVSRQASHHGAWMLNLILPKSIRLKLMLAFTMMAVITGTIGAWSIWQINVLGDINKKTYDRTVMAINYARWANTEFERLANDTLRGKIQDEAANGGEDLKADILDNLDVAEKSATSPAATADVQKLRVLVQRWLALQDGNAKHVKLLPLAAMATEIRHRFEILVEQNSADGFRQRTLASNAEIYALRLSVTVTAAALALSFLMTLILSRRVVRPLTAAANVAKRIASGELDTLIPRGGKDEAGALLSSMSVMQSRILQMMEAETSRRRSAQGRLIAALETLTSAMLLLDSDGNILIANSKVDEFLSVVSAKVQIGTRYSEAFPPSDVDWASLLRTPGEVLMPNGRWVHITQEETNEGGTFLILADVTERKGYEQKLETVAYRDPTTELRNRAFLLMHAKENDWSAYHESALIIINVERFRQINNAHSYAIGDKLLKHIAGKLNGLIFEPDISSRVGPDEFAIWISRTDEKEFLTTLEQIRAALAQPLEVDDIKLEYKTRIGAARSCPEVTSVQDLSRDARAAMAHAKRIGGGRIEVFGADLRQESQLRMQIERDLPSAIRRSEIYMDYQPLINTRTRSIGGFEALARWRHDKLGQIPPMRFVSVAEETGSIVDLGMFVLNSAAAQAAVWSDAGQVDDKFTIAINLSPKQIVDPRNARQILNYLDGLNGSAKRLKLEITESVLLEDPTAMIALLNEFKARGCELSLDDFGTGYSSLSYLHKFPFDVLKIDRSFVMNMDKDPDALRLVRTIVELGQDLGLTLVAEGVETAPQAALLTDLGCDFIQGYYFSRPIGVAAAGGLLDEHRVWT